MNSKDVRSRWLAGLAFISALGLGIAIYQVEKERALDQPNASTPIGHELADNAANGLNPPPTVGASASAPITPLAFLLGHRRQRGSAEQGVPNASIDLNKPALAAEMSSANMVMTAPFGAVFRTWSMASGSFSM